MHFLIQNQEMSTENILKLTLVEQGTGGVRCSFTKGEGKNSNKASGQPLILTEHNYKRQERKYKVHLFLRDPPQELFLIKVFCQNTGLFLLSFFFFFCHFSSTASFYFFFKVLQYTSVFYIVNSRHIF